MKTKYDLKQAMGFIDNPKQLREAAKVYKYEVNLSTYFPFGHPHTMHDGDLWKEENRLGNWEEWSQRPWQIEFHSMGATHKERMLMCANGVGKSISGAYEAALHATGLYPEWWTGYRFKTANKGWVGSITNEMQKSHIQQLLLGSDLSEELGTGFIPRSHIIGKPSTRQCGINGVIDEAKIRHASGGISLIQFKTYAQGWRTWQATAPHWVWMDEEPDENISDQKDIFAEVQTRLVRTSGILWVTYTPLLGQTHLTRHFLSPKAKGIGAVTATWDDAPHLKKEDKDRLIATYPEYQVQARTQGIPMLGEGAIFTIPESEIVVPPFQIPPWFARIKGIDFGIDHPAAVADIAWDRDKDIIYVTRVWRKHGADVSTHCEAIIARDPWVPVAWPHDGLRRANGRSGNEEIKDLYRDKGIKLLSMSARYKRDKGGSQAQWPVIKEIQEREEYGGFKVFANCYEYLEERRNYHTKEGKIVSNRDDTLKAVFYAVMQKRSAIMQYNASAPSYSNVPQGISMRH